MSDLINHEIDRGIAFWDGSSKIVPHLLYRFMETNGFGKYFPDDSKLKNTEPVIVKIKGNIVSEVNVGFILETVNNYILQYFAEGGESGPVLDSLHKSMAILGDKNLKLLPTLKLEFISDVKGCGNFFFKNGVVQVTTDGITQNNYNEFDQFVWESSIIDLEYVPVEKSELDKKCDFMKFLWDLCKVADEKKTESRFYSLSSAVGYLLHRYKDGTTNKAIILMDIFVNGMPNGGSGKSLLVNSIGKIRNLATIDGKKYDQREWFGLSSVGLDTELLLFDDVKKNFDFEQLFPLMTEGLFQRRKYKDHLFIPHSKSPKVAITTNYAINGESSSFKRRQFEFEVSATYSADYSPRDKFGRNFFDEWQAEDWNYFYNTMLQCLHIYLTNGLIEAEPISINLTKLINKTNEDFVEWAGEYVGRNIQLDKKQLYAGFLNEFSEYNLRLKQREFTSWLRDWGEYQNLKITEGHTDDLRYIIFSD